MINKQLYAVIPGSLAGNDNGQMRVQFPPA